MKYHALWTVFPRKMKSGRVVWYYRAWLGTNERTGARSTGCTTKGAAKEYVRGLEKAGTLIATDAPVPTNLTFKAFADGFWDWEGEYVQTRLKFSDPKKPALSPKTAKEYERSVRLHLLPAFGRRLVETITPQDIESFSLRLRDKGYSGKRVNNVTSTLRTMLIDARRRGILPWDPAVKNAVRALGNAPKRRGRLNVDEVLKLFAPENFETAWRGHRLYYLINLVAAATGCRQGELLALRDGDVFDDHLHIEHSWSLEFGLGPTKTRQNRDVPISPRVRREFEPFLGSGGFVFSTTRGKRPLTGGRVTDSLYHALDAIGVTDREERNITFHSWRHWLSSVLRANAVPDDIVRKVTGHATEAMLENYTAYLAADLAPVVRVQEEIFG